MASYSVAAGAIGAYAKTLVASTVDTITFADDVVGVEVVSDGSAAVYFTVDGTAPTVAGASTYLIPAGLMVRSVKSAPSNGVVVKVISAGTPVYSVARAS